MKYNFVLVKFFTLFFFTFRFLKANSQGYILPNYCNSFSVTNGQRIGVLGYEILCGTINNTTTTSNATFAFVFWLFQFIDTGYAGSVQNWSIVIGGGNRTRWNIYIDWNNDGVFNTSGIELAYAVLLLLTQLLHHSLALSLFLQLKVLERID